MFRHLSQSKRLLTLLLPFTFLLGWAACLSVCAESAAPSSHNQFSAAQTIEQGNETCADETDGCTMISAVAVNQERQIAKAPVFSSVYLPVFLRDPSPAWAALLPEIKQNSPPETSLPPLFVRLCTFRI